MNSRESSHDARVHALRRLDAFGCSTPDLTHHLLFPAFPLTHDETVLLVDHEEEGFPHHFYYSRVCDDTLDIVGISASVAIYVRR